jgi:SOS-response transcriptional repressor LexA
MAKNNFEFYLEKLKKYYWDNWVLPTFDIMLELTWLSSREAIAKFFNQLLENWYLMKKNSSKWYTPTEKLISFPLFSKVSCWTADEIESNIINYIDVNKYVLWWNPNWIILVEVKWDSMEDAWIYEWDIVSLDINNKYPYNWDLVIASIDWENEFTLKRYIKNQWNAFLEYQNEKIYSWKKIEAKQITIIWVVKWLIRKF